MAMNYDTGVKIAKMNGQHYYSNKGNVHKAVELFDDEGTSHGHAIYTIRPGINDKPAFNIFVSKEGLQTKSVNYWTCEKIKMFEGNYYYTKHRKYRAYSLYDKKGKYRGYVVYSYSLDGNEKEYITFIREGKCIQDS